MQNNKSQMKSKIKILNPRIKARIRKNKQIFKKEIKNFFEWVSGAELVNLKECNTNEDLYNQKTVNVKYEQKCYCKKCNGYRLNNNALAVKILNKNIGDLTKESIKDLKYWFDNINKYLSKQESEIAESILREINERLNFLSKVSTPSKL